MQGWCVHTPPRPLYLRGGVAPFITLLQHPQNLVLTQFGHLDFGVKYPLLEKCQCKKSVRAIALTLKIAIIKPFLIFINMRLYSRSTPCALSLFSLV